MRGMRSDFDPNRKIDWGVIRQVIPYLLEYKARVGIALACLIAAKLASIGMPFVLKRIVDDLDTQLGSATSQALSIPIALLFASGFIRLANSLFGEVRDHLFGLVT